MKQAYAADFRKQKAERIASVLTNAAGAIAKIAVQLGNHVRKKPRIVSKRISFKRRMEFRRRSCFLIAQMGIIKGITMSQLAIVISQPIPKFKPGGVIYNEKESPYGSSTIGETGQELINGSIVPDANAIQSLPAGQRDNL